MKKLLSIGCAILFIGAANAAPAPFHIVIDRMEVKDGLVIGTIAVNGTVIGQAFENADLKIPIGQFDGIMRYSSPGGLVQGPDGKLGKEGDFLLEVARVPGRSNILFHSGNKPKHSKGCILLGPSTRTKDGKVAPEPLQELRRLFYGTNTPNATPNKAITITIKSSLPAGG
jgi:hypothetical protein